MMSPSMSARDERNWRSWILGGYVAVVVIVALLWGWSLFCPIDDQEEKREYERLDAVAQVAAVACGQSDEGAQALADALSAERLRVSIIGADGTVLADSVDAAASMGNHASRPEVAAALAGQVGHARRASATDGTDYLYVAVPATLGGVEVVVRVASPVAAMRELSAEFRNTGFVLLAVAVIAGLLVFWLAFSRSEKPAGRLERMRTDFVANASHELKTPVAGIALLSESIEQAAKDGDGAAVSLFAGRLEKETARLQHLVADLLDLSRLESRDERGHGSETCDLLAVVAVSFESQLPRAEAKGIAMHLDDAVDANRMCRVKLPASDASLLVDNLLENAVNYTEEGGVDVRLAIEEDSAVLRVKDTGIGIPFADQERVFERFYRVDTARSREMGGTGLGLSIVRHAVEQAGGSVQLDSAPHTGSAFTVKLPLAV